MRLAALVLAAGASRRAGGINKLLACDRTGTAMIVRTVTAVLDSRATEVIVVIGHDAAPLADALSAADLHPHARLRVVEADDHARGLSASLRCGIAAAVGCGADGALVCLGDMPLVRPATLDRLMTEFGREPGRIAWVPTAGGRRGNPVLWHSHLFAALLELSGDAGGRLLLKQHAPRVREVPVEDPGVLEDFDTPERLEVYAMSSAAPA